MNDRGPLLALVVAVSIGATLLVGSCIAPCSWYGCAPLTQTPSRCFGVRQ